MGVGPTRAGRVFHTGITLVKCAVFKDSICACRKLTECNLITGSGS